MAEYILEILSEEIPARMQLSAAEGFERNFSEKLKSLNIYYNHLSSFVTPRRIVIYADGLSLTQEDSVQERKGPRIDAPEQAIAGFLRSTGLEKNQLTTKSTPKGDFYFAIIRDKGKPTKEILKTLTEQILAGFIWPKSMRWGKNKIRWVRPIQAISCIFGNEVLPVEFGHITAGNITRGHRFLGNTEIKISDFESYMKALNDNYVMLDHKARKQKILSDAELIAKDNGLEIIADEGLLNEVTGLVEWPVTMLGSIDKSFMSLPDEVLLTTIKVNQKYFCTKDKKGKLAPYFIFVSNMKSTDGGEEIINGNQRVLKARLSDAVFFYNIDKSKGLKNFLPQLEDIIFHAKVGSIRDRVERIKKLSEEISSVIDPKLKKQAVEAADLCKADLASEMVNEFPDLQGTMGYYYALEDKKSKEVAEAIRDHYCPMGPNDKIPASGIASIVAIAEKIDSLISLFAAGERATGSKDPYALKRAALGVIRIIIENNIVLPLLPILKKAVKLLPSHTLKGQNKDDLKEEIVQFILDRVKYQLKSSGFEVNIISSVINTAKDLDVLEIKNKVEILSKFESSDDGEKAIEAYKRAAHILEIEEKKDDKSYSPKPSKSLFQTKAEQALFEELEDTRDITKTELKKGNFSKPLAEFTRLTNFINNFYDNAQINANDTKVRENRLKLSAMIVESFKMVADFDLI